MEIISDDASTFIAENGKLHIKTASERELENKEVFGYIGKMQEHSKKLMDSVNEEKKRLEDGFYQKNLERLEEDFTANEIYMAALIENSEKFKTELKDKLKPRIKQLKADMGYSRVKKEEVHLLRNKILSKALMDLEKEGVEIDRSNPMIQEMSIKFDEI